MPNYQLGNNTVNDQQIKDYWGQGRSPEQIAADAAAVGASAEQIAEALTVATGQPISVEHVRNWVGDPIHGYEWSNQTGALIPLTPTGQPPKYNAFTSSPAPQYTPYQEQAFNFQEDPGYQFRLAQGQKALQARQLAQGDYLSGGALKELDDYSQGLASQEYGNAFSRYRQGEDARFRTNQANNQGQLTNWQANDSAQFRNNEANFNNAFSRWSNLDNTAYQRNWNEENRDYSRWTDDYNRGREADNTNWNRLTYFDQTGINAAGATTAAGQNAANNTSGLLTSGADAQAAGKINGANSWTNAIGNGMYTYMRYGNQGRVNDGGWTNRRWDGSNIDGG